MEKTRASKIVEDPRLRESFDFGWKFFKGDVSGGERPDVDDAHWRDLDLPHDWSIEGPFSPQPGSETSAHLPTGVGWYRKHFRVPKFYQLKTVVIEFDGVYQNSEVWINGHYLGKRPYGYIGFHYSIRPYLNFGGDNVIAVKVDNSRQPNCRWYSGSGIYRHTWLLVTNKIHIAHWGTFITTPGIGAESAIVRIVTRIQNDNKSNAYCVLASSIIDRDGKVIQTAKQIGKMPANGGEDELVQEMTVKAPHLWSPDDPYLYIMRSAVNRGPGLADVYETPFGIRQAVFDADKGFMLNGQHVKLHGVCLHHEAGAVGAAVPERVWERRLQLLKEMGCNSIRTSHNPYAPEFMDLCDKMGFLVMDEVFDEWKEPKRQTPDFGYRLYFDSWSEKDVTDFVRRDRNHPSVVLWSAGNEVVDQVASAGPQTLKRLIGMFHREDPTRLVTVGCDRIVAEPAAVSQEFLSLLDVVGYNYVDRWRDRAELYYSIDRHAFPKRKFIGTENGSLGGIRGDYYWLFPTTRVVTSRNSHDRWTDFQQMWKFVRLYDYVAGDYMWTGIDYLGESKWPRKGNTAGVLDTCGFKKDSYYFCQSQWTEKPMLHLLPHWNWQGKEGEVIPVLCYTNCDCVELFLNGRSLGVQGYWFPRYGMQAVYENHLARNSTPRTTLDLHLRWTVPFQTGTLKVVGYKDGKAVVTEEITTTGQPAAVVLSADSLALAADCRDVAHVTAAVVDAQGRVVPVADNEIFFGINGRGKLIGLDNGNPASLEDYKGNRRKAFNGMCLAIVQSTVEAGRIQLTASSPGLKSDNVIIVTSKTHNRQ
jgi:beta-galactosidase